VGFPAERAVIVEGFLRADLAAELLPGTVAFAYLDFDLYEPIRTALELMDPRCRPGSVLMVDDYGYFCSGPRTAVEEFLADRGHRYELVPAPPGTGHFCALRRRD
jgi:O-methyltransferase